jgi:signal transduction histidine kinase
VKSRSLRTRILIGTLFSMVGVVVAGHYFVQQLLLHGMPGLAHFLGLGSLGVFVLVVGLLLLRDGVSSVSNLRSRLAAVREGREQRVTGDYPTEIQPLVDDLNSLLHHRDEAVARAVAKAGDLAHGIKTPLAVLAREAERAEDAGHHELASTMRLQVERMQRQVDYHLAQARAAASSATLGVKTPVVESAEALARTLRRLHDGRGIAIDVAVPADHVVAVQRADLDEMLGNLLDNACRYARTRVQVSTRSTDATVAIVVDDDGPGLDESLREVVLKRGVRADEAGGGSGLGLAVVCDLASLYAGSIALDRADLGGLRARLVLPGTSSGAVLPSGLHVADT